MKTMTTTVYLQNNVKFARKLFVAITALSLMNMSENVFADQAETVEYRVDQEVERSSRSRQSSIKNDAFLMNNQLAFVIEVPKQKLDFQENGQEKPVGVVYSLPEIVTKDDLQWERVEGGYVARIAVHAEQATKLRLHLLLTQDIPSLQIRLLGNKDANFLAVMDYTSFYNSEAWLPITSGNTAEVEIFVGEGVAPSADFKLDAVNVIVLDEKTIPVKTPKKTGAAQELQYDLACYNQYPEYNALKEAAAATALIHYVKNGLSYTCTGTLLNDEKSSNTPWFATANHCISDQATANTATFQWFYQATACGSRSVDYRNTQTYGGAQFLWGNAYYDAALLKLNMSPPRGTVLMGWNTKISRGERVFGVHHPMGDHAMVSVGWVSSLGQLNKFDEGLRYTNVVNFQYGSTEGGSSGSGLFGVSGKTLYWKGTLIGGPTHNPQISMYSDFNSYYPNIRTWLAGSVVQNTPEQYIDQLYSAYQGYFGAKHGKSYQCYQVFTCQKFTTGRIIAANLNMTYWWDNHQWNRYR